MRMPLGTIYEEIGSIQDEVGFYPEVYQYHYEDWIIHVMDQHVGEQKMKKILQLDRERDREYLQKKSRERIIVRPTSIYDRYR